jgi:hypothetical protein
MVSASKDPYEAAEHAVDEHDLEELYPRRGRSSMSSGNGSKLIVGIGSDHSDKDIKVFIRVELDALNRSAGSQQ